MCFFNSAQRSRTLKCADEDLVGKYNNKSVSKCNICDDFCVYHDSPTLFLAICPCTASIYLYVNTHDAGALVSMKILKL